MSSHDFAHSLRVERDDDRDAYVGYEADPDALYDARRDRERDESPAQEFARGKWEELVEGLREIAGVSTEEEWSRCRCTTGTHPALDRPDGFTWEEIEPWRTRAERDGFHVVKVRRVLAERREVMP